MKKEIELIKADALLHLDKALKKAPEHAKQLKITIAKLESILENINENNSESDIEGFEAVLSLCKKDIYYIAEKLYSLSYRETLH